MNGDEYLKRVRTLIPVFRERAALTERTRRLPDESWADFQRAGLLRALQPARWGGFELHPAAFYRAVMEVSGACPSTGWVLGVLGVHSWQLAAFPERAQQEIWGADSTVQASSSYAPTGKIERVEGGFKLSGRWSFSSGCDFCHWVILGGSTRNPDGTPDARSYLLPRSDYKIDDNWHVMGLTGSGSKDIVVSGAFVPEYRTHKFLDAYNRDNPGQAVNQGALYRLAWASVFAYAIAAPAIGAATGALDCWREGSRARRTAYDHKMVAEDPFAQMRLAEAASAVDGARQRMLDTFDEMMRLAADGREISVERRARLRWDAANAVQLSVHAVDLMFESSGGRAIFLDNPIQRYFRDVHAIRAHALNNPQRAGRTFAMAEMGSFINERGFPADIFI
ncbi:MAG: 3-hydroxy-9,10-secoandrosta-1,3,5(10)-triene-9,17-dione monooxygenase oxygenase subunit [Candidatus Binataceae bacterium]